MTGLCCPAAFATTAGWEDVCPRRREFPPTEVLWRADFSRKDDFSFELRGGAEGKVEIADDGIHVVKTNGKGEIVVKAKPFAVRRGRGVRFQADQSASRSDVNFSSALLRYHGRREKGLGLQYKAEKLTHWYRGNPPATALQCTAPGTRYRRYGQCFAEDDVLTPVLVIAGAASDSVWSNWCAEDLAAADRAWKDAVRRRKTVNRLETDAISDAELDARLRADGDHTAEVRRIDGVSRLLVDGEVSAPAVYKAHHTFRYFIDRGECHFAGKPFSGSAVKLAVVSSYPWIGGLENTNRYEVSAMAAEVRRAMRIAPEALFMVGICVTAPPDFVAKDHPEEAWLTRDGRQVMGTVNTCLSGFNASEGQFRRGAFPWPSFSSRVWRDWAKGWIRDFVAELKRQGLSKRVVGAHLFGYHDQQMTVCFSDFSKPAQEEYRRMIAEPDCISTNYAFCMRLAGHRALEEFAREFKRALGKPSVVAKYSESPFQDKRGASNDLTAFVHSDALDVIVCQPNYRDRLPGFSIASAVPFASLHLHGKMFWNEYDLRTWCRNFHDLPSAPGTKSYGMAWDLPMWRTMVRKLAGEADATRTGYWLYDMADGWYDDPGLAADIRALAEEEEALARRKPSAWRPDVAVVVDEAQMAYGPDPLQTSRLAGDFIYVDQCRHLVSSGVPYETYLAEDVLRKPEILSGHKLVVFAFLRTVDDRRAALVARLRSEGKTLVYLSETGAYGGGERLGFSATVKDEPAGRRIVPEPGVTDELNGQFGLLVAREYADADFKYGPRCTVAETPGVRVLARYASDGLPALAERRDGPSRSVYVCEPSGLTPGLFNRLAREALAYVAVAKPGLQLNMNGDFVSVHCLCPGTYDFTLPFDAAVTNLRTGLPERTENRRMSLTLTAGETCRFSLEERK